VVVPRHERCEAFARRLGGHTAMDPRTISTVSKTALQGIRHVPPAQPLRFFDANPEWQLGESLRHFNLCALLYQVLRQAVTPRNSVGCDQFVYFDASDPRRCLAPDGFVKLGAPQEMFASWRVWEKGAPELCIEVLSPSDQEPITFAEKLARYQALGVRELIVFQVDEPVGKRIRAWDRVEDDLLERIVGADATPCTTLDLFWVVAPARDLPLALRLAHDAEGLSLVPTPEEVERAAKEREHTAKEAERTAKEAERTAKEAALAEVDRLRAELASKKS